MIRSEDRYWIERKFHDPEAEFNPHRRMQYHGAGYRADTGLDDDGLLAGLQELDLAGLPHPEARARAIAWVLAHERLYVNEHDWFVGLYSLNRLANSVTMRPWQAESRALQDPELVQAAADFNASGAVTIWTDYDHVVPDWDSLMTLGFPGIRERARQYRKKHEAAGTLDAEAAAYFDGIEIEYTAILDLLDRMAQVARGETFEKAQGIARCLEDLREGAPQNSYEAMQLIWVYFIVSESIDNYQVRSLGNGLDHTLRPFWERDLEKGTFTHEQLREFLAYFLLQWSSIGNYWGQPFYMGGTNPDGSSRYCALSRDILEVYDELDIYNPKIQLKIGESTPDWLLTLALEMVRGKNASLVFCCEPGMVRAVMGYGATYEEALTMDIRGCYETGVRANEVCSSSGYVNAAKALLYVFSDGFDEGTGKQVGIHTGDLSAFPAFSDFYAAFLRQWKHLIRTSMRITDDAERFLAYVNPSSMYSATIETSLRQGRDGYGGAVKFSNNAILNCAFASAADSLLAVKELVYDTGEVTLAELRDILAANWEGHEALRRRVRKSPHRYGNGDALADTYAAGLADFFTGTVNNVPNGHGGVYKAIAHSARQYIVQGEKTGALPDGRLAGEELSKNAGPEAGMDRAGVTGLIRSALRLNPSGFHESFCVDVLLHPSAVAGDAGLDALKGILRTYMDGYGMSIQFNIFSTDTLRDAQAHPERYASLQVRVCGWNALWNNLPRSEQEAFIQRMERNS